MKKQSEALHDAFAEEANPSTPSIHDDELEKSLRFLQCWWWSFAALVFLLVVWLIIQLMTT